MWFFWGHLIKFSLKGFFKNENFRRTLIFFKVLWSCLNRKKWKKLQKGSCITCTFRDKVLHAQRIEQNKNLFWIWLFSSNCKFCQVWFRPFFLQKKTHTLLPHIFSWHKFSYFWEFRPNQTCYSVHSEQQTVQNIARMFTFRP